MPFSSVNGVRFYSFDIFPDSQVTHAIFTRNGGLSPDPWASLNVGGTVGDERETVRQNRIRCFETMGRDPHSMFDVWQVHSADVVIANAPHNFSPPEFKADAIITDNPEVTLFMRFADCTPILLYDPTKKAVGIAHAGWVGTVKQTAGATVKAMTAAYGSDPADIVAAIGPAIGPDHYEVGADVIERGRQSFHEQADSLFTMHGDKVHFDLWAANRLSLANAGVTRIETAGICTACHPEDWYSHRAQKGRTGRFGALIALK